MTFVARPAAHTFPFRGPLGVSKGTVLDLVDLDPTGSRTLATPNDSVPGRKSAVDVGIWWHTRKTANRIRRVKGSERVELRY
jgi:hypothetical protein